ncbi:MAG: nickel pincer cofactor biosynthesis protein LarB [Planctomycetaceae bacterium]|nr:nickel pincer cofactor biosynthesis protein LarB [Planctomycetaceae bacterium]
MPDSPANLDVDLDRERRCGFPEVIFGSGKSPQLIIEILQQQQLAGQDGFVTRVETDADELIQRTYPQAISNPVARTVRVPCPGSREQIVSRESGSVEAACKRGPVYVVTAGSSDRPVAEEALETLRWMKVDCDLLADCGVAGPHRLQRHLERLRSAVAIVCVAGMEAALPSVVGGHVACPVIGVPTSVGYGASLNGMTALLSMLTCCSSNVVAVNVDAGFKGGYVAGLIATQADRTC